MEGVRERESEEREERERGDSHTGARATPSRGARRAACLEAGDGLRTGGAVGGEDVVVGVDEGLRCTYTYIYICVYIYIYIPTTTVLMRFCVWRRAGY